MLSKTIVFALVFLFAFGAFMALLPVGFQGIGTSAEHEFVITELNANNLIVYQNQGTDNMTYGYSSLEDAPNSPQWNASLANGQYLEVWWGQEYLWGEYFLEIRHVASQFWGWQHIDYAVFYFTNGSVASQGVTVTAGAVVPVLPKEALVQAWDSSTNASVFTAKCGHASISIFFKPWGSDTIGESYDAGQLQYGLSYEWSADATGFNVLSLLSSILFFQGLNLGIPSIYGGLLSTLLGTFFWIVLAFAVYKIFAGLIPWMSGGSGD